MRTTKKIKFTGFPDYHNPREQVYYRYLAERYDFVESDTPDYVIDGGQSFEHVKYDAVKILICSENDVPDFNSYDYAIGSVPLQFDDRYLRMPWFAFSDKLADALQRPSQHDIALSRRKFCSFVVSNVEFGDPLRKTFFETLSKYKKVDSGGRYLNNVGGAVSDKVSFCREYKFNIAFENSSYPGYVTEKIVEAYAAHSIPIYYGSPTIGLDFRNESMIRVNGAEDVSRAVEEIIRLDNDEDAYMKKVAAPCCDVSDVDKYINKVVFFLSHVFDQPLVEAKRLCPYGHQAMMRRHLKYVHGLDYRIGQSDLYRLVTNVAGFVRRLRK